MKSTAQTPNVIDFPLFDGKVAHFAKLDGFVMTVLAGRIGFEGGAYALHMAGYEHIGDIAGTTPQEIGKVQGIGPRKLEHIRRHLQALGLDFGQDVSDWREYRKRFPDAPPDRPATYSPGYKRRRHLRLVVGGRAFQPEPA